MYDPTDQQLVLQTIRDVAGEAGMQAVRKARGGTEIWIPLDPKPDHWMSLAVGHEAAQEISRRLTVIDADGRRVCNMQCYIGLGTSRIQELRAKIASEICDALLLGLGTREVALKVRTSERDVLKQRQFLIADGRLNPLPVKRRFAALPAQEISTGDTENKKQLWEIRNTITDEGILKGHSTRTVSMAAEVSPSHVRLRRKILLASGRLKPGRVGAVRTSPDHSANIGEMVEAPSAEVQS